MPNKQQKHNIEYKDEFMMVAENPLKPEPQTFAQFAYDKESGSIFGRTPKQWIQLLIFYLIFYTLLAAFFAICMQGLFASLSDEFPKWQLDSSRISDNPGMSFRPILNPWSGQAIIKFSTSSKNEVKQFVRSLNEFLQPYKDTSTPIKTKRVPCDFDKPPKADEVCKFEIDPSFGDCADYTSFGFNKSAPCVFLKLNKIFGWIPEYFNDPANLDSDMPDDLVKHINSIKDSLELNQIWVSCKEQKPDTVRDIKFVGSRGFPGYFYPFLNRDGYQSPLVPIQIRLEPNQIEDKNLVQIECRAWAKNIKYSGSKLTRAGSVLIDLTIAI